MLDILVFTVSVSRTPQDTSAAPGGVNPFTRARNIPSLDLLALRRTWYRFSFVVSFAVWMVLLAALWAGHAAAKGSEADVFVAQAVLAYEDKRYEEALGLLVEALRLDPKNEEALY